MNNQALRFRNPITVTITHLDRPTQEFTFLNGMADVGRQYALDSSLNGVTPVSNWYLGLINQAGFTSVDATDTRASHPNWSELTAYTEGTLPEWVKSRTGNIMSNPSPAVFNFTTSEVLKGLLVGESNTKGGSTGILWSTALFPVDVNVSNGSTLNVTYSVEAI